MHLICCIYCDWPFYIVFFSFTVFTKRKRYANESFFTSCCALFVMWNEIDLLTVYFCNKDWKFNVLSNHCSVLNLYFVPIVLVEINFFTMFIVSRSRISRNSLQGETNLYTMMANVYIVWCQKRRNFIQETF